MSGISLHMKHARHSAKAHLDATLLFIVPIVMKIQVIAGSRIKFLTGMSQQEMILMEIVALRTTNPELFLIICSLNVHIRN